MSTKEIIAIIAAVAAVCLVVWIGTLLRGESPEESEPGSIVTTTSVTTTSTNIWDKLRAEETTTETTDYFSQEGSVPGVLTTAPNQGGNVSGSDVHVTEASNPMGSISISSTTTTVTTVTTTKPVTTTAETAYTIVIG